MSEQRVMCPLCGACYDDEGSLAEHLYDAHDEGSLFDHLYDVYGSWELSELIASTAVWTRQGESVTLKLSDDVDG